MTKDNRYRCVLLFGPPGVGKGTQGKILSNIPGFFHLSVGDVFRSIDIGSPDGKEVYRHISKGQLVPDTLTMKLWKKAVDAYVALSWFKPHEDLLVLDGMPRNTKQVDLVQEHLEIHRIIYLESSDPEKMVHRLGRRALREGRMDDANEDVIRDRFRLYEEVTAPVLECYDDDMIHKVDCFGSPAEIVQDILNVVIPVQNEHFRLNN